MRAINAAVINPWFITVYFGTGSKALAVWFDPPFASPRAVNLDALLDEVASEAIVQAKTIHAKIKSGGYWRRRQ